MKQETSVFVTRYLMSYIVMFEQDSSPGLSCESMLILSVVLPTGQGREANSQCVSNSVSVSQLQMT